MLSINKLFVSIIVLLCIIEGGLLKKIPEYIQICKRDPSTVNDCVLRSIESLRPQLVNGIPELDVPGLDPFIIPEIEAVDGSNLPIRASGKNIKVTGGGNFTIKTLAVDLSKPDVLKINARVRFPKLHFEGRYKLNTQILALPLNGQGTLNADSVKCDADLVLYGDVIEKDGIKSIKFTKLDIDISVKDYRIRLDGLFNGDKVLGQVANDVINQNKDEFLKTTKPVLEKTITKTILEIANKVVDELPYDEVLPKP